MDQVVRDLHPGHRGGERCTVQQVPGDYLRRGAEPVRKGAWPAGEAADWALPALQSLEQPTSDIPGRAGEEDSVLRAARGGAMLRAHTAAVTCRACVSMRANPLS